MEKSIASRASNASSQMLEDLANRSVSAKILRVEGSFNDEEMRLIWNAIGLYISRNLRMGRGVNIPKLGIFTFTPPEVRLPGVTNEKQRDQRPRIPVFLIQKDFIKGLGLKSAIFYHQQFGLGLRPYSSVGTTGDVPVTKMNLIEIASYANMSKDATELGINRIIKYISERILTGQNVNIQIPNVGQFICKNNLVAVKFNEYLHRDTRTILSKSVDQRKARGNMSLTTDNLKKFAHLSQMNQRLSNAPQQFLDIDEKTKTFLRTDFGFHFNSEKDPMKNSLSDFGRTFASRQFDTRNSLLKTSQAWRMSQSGFLTGQIKSFSREYNMALKLLKEWVVQNCPQTENSFKDFVKLTGRTTQALNEDDVWQACKIISSDITEQQSHQLFRLLDFNKDGFVTKDDWKKNIPFDTNVILKSTVEVLRRKNIKANSALKIMGLQGISQVDVFTLQNSLRKLNPSLTEEEAQYLSRFISKGNKTVEIESILQILNIGEGGRTPVDKQWEQKFIARLKKKMYQSNVFEEELQNRFRFYDKRGDGFVQQTQLKNVLAELGIHLTLSELLKIVQVFPIDKNNYVNYRAIMQKIDFSDFDQDERPITYEQFVKVLKENWIDKGKNLISLPISVRKFTSEIQSLLFKNQQQSHLLNFVKKIDVNRNDEISEQDFNAFKSQIKQKTVYRPEKTTKVNLEDLVVKMRQKSIKKKISFYDVFNKLDANKDGFITIQEWKNNIDWLLPLEEDQKQLLFNFMDISKLSMIDYKTFLNFMNGKGANTLQHEKYDWVEQTFSKIKQWFAGSGLTVHKSFKLVDRDGDSYINEKDLQEFLIDKIKYHPREINHVRLQKLLKVFDTFKRGKVDETDWQKLLTNNDSIRWVDDAKQQIGIVLSRQYESLSEGFYDITQGDQKLLFNAFKTWVEKSKALSGFLPNQDILKKIFSEFDVHKKGYLLENDFVSLFGSFNWKSEQTKEFIAKLAKKFNNAEEAYRCMNHYSNDKLTQQRFTKFVIELFSNRFKNSDIKNIWKNISSGKSALSFSDFQQTFGHEWKNTANAIDERFPKDTWKYEDFSIIKGTQIRTEQNGYTQADNIESQVRKIVKSVKQILAASPKSLAQAFQQVDTEKTGRLTNLQFKKAFRNLNIALTSKELDLLLNYCDYNANSLLDWKQFIKRFEPTDDEKKLNTRIQPAIQHLSDLMHFYMVSPKDAYRKWNNPRTGFMNFEEFHKMVKQLYESANENIPELSLLKEYFEHIDVRKDGQLDFQQFSQIFRTCNPPSLLMGTVPAGQLKISKNKQEKQKDIPVRDKQVPHFKNSPQYEQFVKFIARNRRFIIDQIQTRFSKDQTLVPFTIVNEILQEIAESNKLQFSTTVVRNSLAFAMTGENVDYKLMLDNFKGRGEEIAQFPLKNAF